MDGRCHRVILALQLHGANTCPGEPRGWLPQISSWQWSGEGFPSRQKVKHTKQSGWRLQALRSPSAGWALVRWPEATWRCCTWGFTCHGCWPRAHGGSAQPLGGEDASRTRRVAAGGMSARSSLPQLPSNGHNVRVRLELGTWARKNRNEIK